MLRRVFLIIGTALLLVPFAFAGKGKGKERRQDKSANRVMVAVFVTPDRTILHDYCVTQSPGLPPGLARRNGTLPPGIEKQLRRKGRLPPGLEKKLVPFPPDLEVRLAPLAPGLERGFIGGRAVIFNSTTRVILDVFVPLP